MSVGCEARYITTAYCLRLLWDRIYEGWSKSASDQGVAVTEEQVLWAIWLMGCGTVTEVARRLRRDKGTISKCVYSLEESGLIIRKAGPDRRSYVFELSPEGDRVRLGLAKAHGRHSDVPWVPGKPNLLIAHTHKGYGVSFIQDKPEWHHRVPTDQELAAALRELGGGRDHGE